MIMRDDKLAAEASSLLRTRVHLLLAACFGVPITLLLGAYVWLAVDHGTLQLWNAVVHESGRYSLQGTIFYYSHFLREIPVDFAYALFLATSFATAEGILGIKESTDRHLAAIITGVTLIAGVTLAGAAMAAVSLQQGLQSAIYDLFQFRTRDDLIAYGSHWHFHWLSTIWFGAATMLYIPFSTVVLGYPADNASSVPRTVKWLPWMYVAALTLLFGLSSNIFMDVRYTGHQAREILTHGPITVLFGLGSLHAVSMLLRRDRSLRGENAKPIPPLERNTWIALVLVFAIPVFLSVVSFSGDLMDVGQSKQGLAAMVAGHAFEHVLDYVFVILLATGIYGSIVLVSAKTESTR